MSQKKCTSDLEPEGLEEVLKYAGPGKGGGVGLLDQCLGTY